MDLLKTPFKGVVADIEGRAAWYKHDWLEGFYSGFRLILFQTINFAVDHCVCFPSSCCCQFHSLIIHAASGCIVRILAPTMYIFFASALPVIAFGAQLSRETSKCLPSYHYESMLQSCYFLSYCS
jgi:hypothetical protein